MLIEKIEKLNEIIGSEIDKGKKCILVIEDNKTHIQVQEVIVNHPIEYIRNLNEISKALRLPVSDMDIILVGFLGKGYTLSEISDPVPEISPYIYFNKPEEVSVNVGSVDFTPPVES